MIRDSTDLRDFSPSLDSTLISFLCARGPPQGQQQMGPALRQGPYDDGLGPLPDGWGMDSTKEGEGGDSIEQLLAGVSA